MKKDIEHTEYMMSVEEIIELSCDLDIYHSVFYAFWSSVKPLFSTRVDTAGVAFDPEGKCIQFLINPGFWEKSSHHRKLFIIAHEMLHILLAHGKRAKEIGDSINPRLSNIAADLCVNPALVTSFGFNRELINDWEDFLWVDTFPIEIPEDITPTYEGYYNFLIKSSVPEKTDSFDDHSGLIDLEDLSESDKALVEKELSDAIKYSSTVESIKNFIDKTKSIEHSEDNKSESKGYIGEPPIVGNLIQHVLQKSVKIKQKWETVIKKWTSFILGEDYEYQWATEDRRFASINSCEEVMIPQLGEVESKIYEKIDILFFLDTSGSCGYLRDRFFKAAMSLNPKKFNVRLFSRTTVAKEIKIEDVVSLNAYGSDRFQCMEDLIQEELASGKLKKYPEGVFHLTDGVDCAARGDDLKPQYPKRWHFFLSDDGTKNRLPRESNVYWLKDFE